MALPNKFGNVTADLVTGAPHGWAVIEADPLRNRWILYGPCLAPQRSGKDGAGSLALPIAESDDILESRSEIEVHALCLGRGDIDSDFTHGRDSLRVQVASLRSGAHDLKLIGGQVAKKRLGHLRAARILGAEKQDPRFDRHDSSYLQIWVILAGLIALLRVQHSA